jgi:signal transduction histidine kinase
VKNPLGAADGYAQLLEMELKGKLGDEQMAVVAGVRRGIRDALAIIADLLDVSRAESSGLSVRPERIDLAAVVSEAIEDHRGAAETVCHHARPYALAD